MQKYDLNNLESYQVIETVIQEFEYTGHIYQVMGGNCLGKDILNFDFECEDDSIENDCSLKLIDEDDGYWIAVLHDDMGNSDRIDGYDKDFNNMIVKYEILGQFETFEAAKAFISTRLKEGSHDQR